MAITIDPGAGSLADAISRLGGAVAGRLNEKKIREKELFSDPRMVLALGPAARAAQKAGTFNQFADSLGITSDAATKFLSVPAGEQELGEIARIRAGIPEKLASVGEQELNIRGRTAAAIGASGLPELEPTVQADQLRATQQLIGPQLKNELSRLNLDEMYFGESLAQGNPRLKALAEASGYTYDHTNATMQNEVLNLSWAAGVPQAEVDLNRLRQRNEVANIGMDSKKRDFFNSALDGYQNYISELPDTPVGRHLKSMAAISVANPGFMDEVRLHSELDLAAARARASKSGDDGDMLLNYTRWRTAMNDALDRSREAEGNGKFEALRDINGLKLLGMQMIQEGSMPAVEITGAREADTFLGIRTKIETFGIAPEEIDKLALAGAMVASGQNSIEELQNSPHFRRLSPSDQARVIAATSAQMAEAVDPEIQRKKSYLDMNPFERIAAFEKAKSQFIGGLPQTFPFNLIKMGNKPFEDLAELGAVDTRTPEQLQMSNRVQELLNTPGGYRRSRAP